MFNYIIVGSGFSGSVIAERIANVLNQKVLVIEKREHVGGNCYDYKNEYNILIHKYGPHLFHTNTKEVFDYLSRFTEWDIYHHRVLAFVDGQKVPIPFNLNSLYCVFSYSYASRLEEKLLMYFDYNEKIPILELMKIEDNDLQFLAQYIYNKIFVNYTSKQWGKKPEEIDLQVTARVPVLVGKDNRYFNDKYQGVPKYGYTEIFKNMLNHKNIKLMLNTNFKEVCQLNENGIYLFGHAFEGKVIYTGMIDELFDYKFGPLPYRSLDLQFETIDVEYFQEVATVNYPNDHDFTRITEFKHLHPIKIGKTTIVKEYPQNYEAGKSEPYYPVFTQDAQGLYNKYFEHAKRLNNLILVGRLAEYKYYDMDDVVERALEVFNKEVASER